MRNKLLYRNKWVGFCSIMICFFVQNECYQTIGCNESMKVEGLVAYLLGFHYLCIRYKLNDKR